ncbi:MAG: hypothetical protein ACYDAJ_04855 [Nitrosotalea sp.]
MVHKKGPDGRYLTPTMEECFHEFAKAIPALTIDNNQRLKKENKLKELQIKTLQDEKNKHSRKFIDEQFHKLMQFKKEAK